MLLHNPMPITHTQQNHVHTHTCNKNTYIHTQDVVEQKTERRSDGERYRGREIKQKGKIEGGRVERRRDMLEEERKN